jgi:antitoxin component YwqK of YwqJK toxin-antitoxin module
MGGFKAPSTEYGGGKNGEPSVYDLRVNEMRTYTKKGYPAQRVRYRELAKNLFEVEVWLENMVKGKGVLGRAVSKLVARYSLRRTNVVGAKQYLRVGKAEVWYFNGQRKAVYENKVKVDKVDSTTETIYSAEFNESGKLIEFEDCRRGDGTKRLVKFQYDVASNTKRVTEWRGKFHSKSTSYDGSVTVRRNDNGLPFRDDGDYTTRTYTDGIMITEESYVAGKQDGFSRTFNKFGRVIQETYWRRGVEVPDWMYLDPKGILPEEIQGESNEELRAIMLELQGTEVYQVRAMARGMRAVSRALISEADSQMSDVTLMRPRLTED